MTVQLLVGVRTCESQRFTTVRQGGSTQEAESWIVMPTLQQYRIRDLDNVIHQISVGKKDAGETCLVKVRGSFENNVRLYSPTQDW